ncbi:MAG: macro domain-containing protein [Rhodospirillales bacterium]|nr:macro domain-containing protein [Rhodospirillales bacterium]MCB9995224.1 macro domain-containing protein [Rhodospirillales bacterium]
MSGFLSEQRDRSNALLIKRVVVTKGDITKQTDVDAIVSSIEMNMDIGGTLNQRLVAAAGNDFDDFILANIYKPRANDVYVVPGFNLPVKHVIFVVTPLMKDGLAKEDVILLRRYRLPMKMVSQMKLKKVAFPAFGTGRNGYPLDRAVRLALKGIMDRMTPEIEEVRIVCDKDKVFDAFCARLQKYGQVRKGV